MFKIGDMAVYPAQGVGVIEAIEVREFVGEKQDFYVLRIVDSDMTIMIPVHNAKMVGMRSLIAKERIPFILNIFQDKPTGNLHLASWSRRQRDYNEKIRSGDLCEIAQVLRELYLIRGEKELSYGEKKVLELARKLVFKELALADGKEEDQVAERVESYFMH